ncbi:MAG: hypothetical protein PVH88_25650 [Ignavibacteria bacterium]|jgi:hypothetical protein
MSQHKNSTSKGNKTLVFRILLAFTIIILVVLYTGGVVTGNIPENQQINAVHLGIMIFASILVALLIRPKLIERLKVFKTRNIEIEWFEKVVKMQDKQANRLDGISLILPLLLPGNERNHLKNLRNGQADAYIGSDELKAELRRIRSMSLLKMKPNHTVGEIENGKQFDLSEFVELTNIGKQWIERIIEIERSDFFEGAQEK